MKMDFEKEKILSERWDREMAQLKNEMITVNNDHFIKTELVNRQIRWDYGSLSIPCPYECKHVGFYSPKGMKGKRQYFACKFCGRWEEVRPREACNGENGYEAYECKPIFCSVHEYQFVLPCDDLKCPIPGCKIEVSPVKTAYDCELQKENHKYVNLKNDVRNIVVYLANKI